MKPRGVLDKGTQEVYIERAITASIYVFIYLFNHLYIAAEVCDNALLAKVDFVNISSLRAGTNAGRLLRRTEIERCLNCYGYEVPQRDTTIITFTVCSS